MSSEYLWFLPSHQRYSCAKNLLRYSLPGNNVLRVTEGRQGSLSSSKLFPRLPLHVCLDRRTSRAVNTPQAPEKMGVPWETDPRDPGRVWLCFTPSPGIPIQLAPS